MPAMMTSQMRVWRTVPPRGCINAGKRDQTPTRPGSDPSHPEEVLTVVPQLVDRLVDVRERFVFALLGKTGRGASPPAPQLFQRAHVEIAIEKVLLEPRHVLREKAPVLVD